MDGRRLYDIAYMDVAYMDGHRLYGQNTKSRLSRLLSVLGRF